MLARSGWAGQAPIPAPYPMNHACKTVSADPRLRWIRALIATIMLGLILSGATAIPLEAELDLLVAMIGPAAGDSLPGLADWLWRVRDAWAETNFQHPFLGYGTDWLAFAHFVIALAFVGPWRDPVRNIWVVEFGMIACVLVVPFAFGMGAIRGIPLGWRVIDCSFGVLGALPLFCA